MLLSSLQARRNKRPTALPSDNHVKTAFSDRTGPHSPRRDRLLRMVTGNAIFTRNLTQRLTKPLSGIELRCGVARKQNGQFRCPFLVMGGFVTLWIASALQLQAMEPSVPTVADLRGYFC